MNSIPNKLMPWLQAIAAMTLIALFCVVTIAPMFSLQPADEDMKATLKDIMLILIGFLFGSAVSSAKKDDQNAALTAQLIPPVVPPPTVPAAPVTVKIDDAKPVAVNQVDPKP